MNPTALKVLIFTIVTFGELLQLVAIVLIRLAQLIVQVNPTITIEVPHINFDDCILEWVTLNPEPSEHSSPHSSDSAHTQAHLSPNALPPRVSPRL